MPMTADEFIRQKMQKLEEMKPPKTKYLNARKRNPSPLDKFEKKVLTQKERKAKRAVKIKRDMQWRQKNRDRIHIDVPKIIHIRDLLQYRPAHNTISEYVTKAILEKLERDGIDIHMFDNDEE